MARPSFFPLAIWLHVAAGSALSGEPSFADLKALAPVVRSSDPGIRSIDVRGYIKCAGIGYVTIRAMYQAPDEKALTRDRGALVVRDRDRRDGTPLLFASERKRLFYDCVEGTLNYTEKHAFPKLAITGDDRELNWSFETETSETGGASILVDIRSAFAGPSKEEKVERAGARKYRLSMKDGSGDTRVFHVDLDNPLKYEKLEVFAPGNDEPTECIEKISVNAEGGITIPSFPTDEQLEGTKIRVRRVSGEGPALDTSMATTELKALLGKLAVDRPDAQRLPVLANLPGLDWNKIKENDRRFSQAIRRLIPPE